MDRAGPGLIAVMCVLVAIGLWRTNADRNPARIDHTRCTAWMADCLPGVGPVSAADAAAAIRRGELAALPAEARLPARQLFTFARHQAAGLSGER